MWDLAWEWIFDCFLNCVDGYCLLEGCMRVYIYVCICIGDRWRGGFEEEVER